MIGVIDAAAGVDHDFRIAAEDGIGLERPNLANEQLAQGHVVGQTTVRLMHEAHACVADDLGCSALFGFACLCQFRRIEIRILAAGLARRAADEPALRTGVDPRGRGSRRPEVRVIRVPDDDHEPARSPGVLLCCLVCHLVVRILVRNARCPVAPALPDGTLRNAKR